MRRLLLLLCLTLGPSARAETHRELVRLAGPNDCTAVLRRTYTSNRLYPELFEVWIERGGRRSAYHGFHLSAPGRRQWVELADWSGGELLVSHREGTYEHTADKLTSELWRLTPGRTPRPVRHSGVVLDARADRVLWGDRPCLSGGIGLMSGRLSWTNVTITDRDGRDLQRWTDIAVEDESWGTRKLSPDGSWAALFHDDTGPDSETVDALLLSTRGAGSRRFAGSGTFQWVGPPDRIRFWNGKEVQL